MSLSTTARDAIAVALAVACFKLHGLSQNGYGDGPFSGCLVVFSGRLVVFSGRLMVSSGRLVVLRSVSWLFSGPGRLQPVAVSGLWRRANFPFWALSRSGHLTGPLVVTNRRRRSNQYG